MTKDDAFEKVKEHVQKQTKLAKQKSKPVKKPKPQVVHQAETSDSEMEVDDTEKCCVCKRYTPNELKSCISLTLVTWGQFDLCDRWLHLVFLFPSESFKKE